MKNEILNDVEGSSAVGKIGDVVYLEQQHPFDNLNTQAIVDTAIKNHQMESAIDGLVEHKLKEN